MSNSGIRLLLSTLHPSSVLDFFILSEGFGWRTVLPFCASCPSEQLQHPVSP